MLDWLQTPNKFLTEQGNQQNDETTSILFEIVGAMGLSTRAVTDIDPYCVVKMGDKEVHRTKTITDDGNPIWTIKTKSLCILDVPKSQEDGTLTVDICHRSKRLGTVTLIYKEILHGKGERKEYIIQPTAGSKLKKAILSIRSRPATMNDFIVLGKVKGAKTQLYDKLVMSSDINFREIKQNNAFQRHRKVGKDKTMLYRIKPYPDPDREEETEWMTKERIKHECMAPSKKWTIAGFGEMGTIYLEILGAKNLINTDVGLNNLTDPFVVVVFEDNMVRTDLLWDELNPRWMPWTNRAFAFKVRHPTSLLMLGLFDYDPEPITEHDSVGRVVINLANFESNTDYVLFYKLHHDPRKRGDDKRGTIIVRLRIEWNDEVEAMKASYSTPPRFIINVDNSKSYHVLKYVTRGMVDMEKPSLTTVKLYLKEFLGNWKHVCFGLDVLFEVLLWRGRLYITPNFSIWFPIQSIALASAVILSIEYPNKVGPIIFYGIAWIMLSINFHASRHPYPWKRVKSSEQRNMVVLLGGSIQIPVQIKPHQGVEAGKKVEKLDNIKADRMSALITSFSSFAVKTISIYNKASTSTLKMATEEKNWGLNWGMSLFNDRFHYPHMILKEMCNFSRMLRNLMNWKGFYAHKVTMDCLLLATLWLVLPVNKIVLWFLRIMAWTLLGPWMKLVDIFFIHSWYKTREELLALIDLGAEIEPQLPDFEAILESDMFAKMGHSGRIVAEESYKLKDMREHIFGHYSETTPMLDTWDACVPLPESFAYPSKNHSGSANEVYQHIPGQQLGGSMVPVRDPGAQ